MMVSTEKRGASRAAIEPQSEWSVGSIVVGGFNKYVMQFSGAARGVKIA